MLRQVLAHLRNIARPLDYFEKAYDEGYHQGLREGRDFGERIAHNQTLALELPRILSRYSQLQLKIMDRRPVEIKRELERFTQKELDKLKLELQDR